MSTAQLATRTARAGLAITVASSAAAVAWRGLVVPALIVDVLACALTLAVTQGRLEALREQARVQEHESLHDPVTELPNRTLFHQQAYQSIAGAQRRGSICAVMLLDLDRFKEINDTLGYHQGDLLLHQIATRLRAVLRAGDLCARLGGDEFAVLAADLESPKEAFLLAERLRHELCRSIELAGISLEVEASIGVSLIPEHGCDVEQLLRLADVAMYQAKRQHTGVELYSTGADDSSRERLEMLSELRAGIAAGELVVHYQPKVAARSGRVRGFEALVRWEHPVRGLLYPDQFVGLAENTGLMRPLTSHVLDVALRQCRAWRDAGHGELTVAVNISTRNLLDGALPGEVARRLEAHGLPAAALELEITETTLMVDPVRAKRVLCDLAELGIGLAIDDFGTGYTSLSWLSELPVTTLKIDKSFVLRMSARSEDEAIVRSSVQLGGNLGLSVVAEGVEDSCTWHSLAELGCDYLQGYYFSRPQSATATEAWLARQEAAADERASAPTA